MPRAASSASTRPAAATPADTDPFAGLGLRIRHGRLVLGLTLKQVAEAAGCSESMLSKIERGQATPSLPALHRLAIALKSNVAELTAPGHSDHSPIARAAERPVIEFKSGPKKKGGIRLERVVMPMRGQLLQADIHLVDPMVSSDEQISHAGEEMGFLLEGELELTLADRKYRLAAGDSFHFPSDTPHSYRNPGKTLARVLWVNTPPTF